ncbi:MAG: hypothetical protein ACI3W7_08480 [Oscillospiraceae bacterium]
MNKKVAAGVAATVAIASIATNLAFTPDELLHDQAYLESHTRYMQMNDQGEYEIEYSEPEELGKKDSARTWLLNLPVPIKALFLLPLWALGAIPVAIGTGIFSALSPIWAQVVSFLLQAGVLVGVFCVVYKLIFPNRKVRELFQKKNRRWLLLGALGVTALNFILAAAWPGWSVARVIIMIVVGFGVLCLLWKRICGKLKGPEPGIVHTKLKLEY